MTFQFVHLESWSRKPDSKGRSTEFVFDEASRKPSASLHVQDPKPPTTIYGIGVEEVRAMHDAAAATENPAYRRREPSVHRRGGLRRQGETAEVRQWERLTIDWLKKQYGPALKSVIRHTDETHWYVLNPTFVEIP